MTTSTAQHIDTETFAAATDEAIDLGTCVKGAVENIHRERCDVCGHRAYVITNHTGLPLSWCAHHYREIAPVDAVVAVDIRDTLNQRPGASA